MTKIFLYYSIQTCTFQVQVCMLIVAGVAGFEPTNDGVRVRCLTAWRHPNMKLSFQTRFSIADKKHKLFPKTKESQFVLPALFYQTFPFFASVFICLF